MAPRRLPTIVGAVLLVLSAASPAHARPLQHGHYVDQFDYVVPDVCGDGVDASVDFQQRVNLVARRSKRDHLPHFTVSYHAVGTWTNSRTGKALQFISNYVDQDHQVTDNGDGTLTVTGRTGGSERTYGPDRQLLDVHSGRTDWQLLLDTGGTLYDVSDDTPLDIQFLSGSRGIDFCTAWAFTS